MVRILKAVFGPILIYLQSIEYGELVEIQTRVGAMTEAVLETAISYSNACESGIIIHISLGEICAAVSYA